MAVFCMAIRLFHGFDFFIILLLNVGYQFKRQFLMSNELWNWWFQQLPCKCVCSRYQKFSQWIVAESKLHKSCYCFHFSWAIISVTNSNAGKGNKLCVSCWDLTSNMLHTEVLKCKVKKRNQFFFSIIVFKK